MEKIIKIILEIFNSMSWKKILMSGLMLALVLVILAYLYSCSVVAHSSTRIVSERNITQNDTIYIKTANKNYKNSNL